MDDIHCRICGATLYEISRLERYFDRLMLTEEPVERSLQVLVRTMAAVLAADMMARGLTETALTRTVDPYCRLLKTWTRDALAHIRAREAAKRRPPHDDA
jgi:hypothetical protein